MGLGLRLLWRCQNDHPLCRVFGPAGGDGEVEMRWLLEWSDIQRMNQLMESYAEKMWSAMDQYSQQQTDSNDTIRPPTVEVEKTEFGLYESKEAAKEMLLTTMQQMSLPLNPAEEDTFITTWQTTHTTLQTTSVPLLSLIPQTTFTTILKTQSNLIQHALLSQLFHVLSLPSHLSTLHDYFLFGNGIFTTRLSEALFEDFDDEDVRSGGQPGLGLGMGILGSGGTWPPSGAKVGLVLRRVLAGVTSDIDVSPSFAYRELSDAQFDRVKNPLSMCPFPIPSFRRSLCMS